MNDNRTTFRLQSRLSALTVAVGLILMIMMIFTEDEPGALPLLLIAAGSVWYFVTRIRARSGPK
jgi:hypothetical protein